MKRGVYQIECSFGHICIGGTGRELKVRLNEHLKYCQYGNHDSAVANNILKNIQDPLSHGIKWSQAKFLCEQKRHFHWKFNESALIMKATAEKAQLMNRKNEMGSEWLTSYWNRILYESF